jgi:hypothetical protein
MRAYFYDFGRSDVYFGTPSKQRRIETTQTGNKSMMARPSKKGKKEDGFA